MVTVDRRSAFKLGLAGAAGVAMSQIKIGTSHAQAAASTEENPGFYRFKLGDFEVISIQDGIRVADGPHPTFGSDQEAAEVAALLEANMLPSDKFANGFTPVLIKAGDDLVLFDTGFGAAGQANGLGKLKSRMQAAGYKPEDVSIVVITHMHGDHIGGLMENGAPAFANARYVMGQTEYDFWTAPDRLSGPTEGNAKAVAANIKPLAEKATFIGDNGSVVSGITGIAAPGHTPGHMVFNVESAGKRLVLTADTANHYVVSLQKPDWQVRFDMDKEAAAATRRKVFGMIAADKVPFIGYHMPFPSVGFVTERDGGFFYTPASYQFDI
ncbi:MBL fold metallo-hydrolase [Oryzicola mucosus]|uniref:MBL fold metallo-hydrolase n=1 Tax=Oryzicola mucosus TaxID=2767425 RepID=A0A8J6PNZ1_9HYPH|nr:MBL fold metallo-hydrolase [Oryzicola mucosus]MBD0415642.1 MBL fold metallo-hydrolase [Oryzicola mucosus]